MELRLSVSWDIEERNKISKINHQNVLHVYRGCQLRMIAPTQERTTRSQYISPKTLGLSTLQTYPETSLVRWYELG